MREIDVFKAQKEINVADFDLLNAEIHTFSDLWNRAVPEKTRLKIAYDKKNLYFLFRTEFEGVLPQKYKKKTGKVFRADCTEVFISFDGDVNSYYELDISPFNKAFVAKIENPDDENLGISMLEKSFIITKTQVHEQHYDTLYILPFENFTSGDIYGCDIRCNAYRVKIENKKRVSRALNPTYALSHHIRSSFVRLILK